MDSVFQFFKSVKLAFVLILVIIVFSLLSTLIPQGRSIEEYRSQLGAILAWIVDSIGLDHYTSSFVFFIPVVLFVINLGVCTIDRLVGRAKRKAVKHFGPDLIHVGLLVLCIGALITSAMRKEQDFTMAPGDAVKLPGGYTMSLTNFEFIKYPDGRPKAWISTVDVKKAEALVRKDVKIEVNHPLEIGQLKIYQTSYATEGLMQLVDPNGKALIPFKTGQSFRSGDAEVFFAGAHIQESGTVVATIETWQGQTLKASNEVISGQTIDAYKVSDISLREVTGLRAASDPGFIPVLIALIMGSIGLAMTSIHKSKGDI
jgi:cytochrome c biogenesis protein